MKKLLILLLFISTVAVGQVDLSFSYRFYYNSDMILTDKVFNHMAQEFQSVETTVPQHQNSLIGVSAYIPFTVFDENYSSMYSERFSFYTHAYYLYDHPANEFDQQYYKFGLYYKLFKNQNILIGNAIDVSEIFDGTTVTVWTGYDYKVGLSYNMLGQETPNLVNFYAALNYILYSQYNTLNPAANLFDASNDFETEIGIIINVKDIFFIEQGVRTISESNLPDPTFSPYYSDYKTKFTLKWNHLELDFTHICFHPIVSTNKNPQISGVLNSVGLTFNL